jgi:hypothetical protein
MCDSAGRLDISVAVTRLWLAASDRFGLADLGGNAFQVIVLGSENGLVGSGVGTLSFWMRHVEAVGGSPTACIRPLI